MNKEFVYHSSTSKHLTVIEPQRTLSNGKYIGDYIFATANRLYAVMYLANRGLYKIMNSDSTPPRIIIGSNKDRYLANDKGGSIYKLPAKHFTKSPQQELSDTELVASKKITPLHEKSYATSLEAFNKNGIEIYFVEDATMDEMIKNKNEVEIIEELTPYNR